MSRTRYFFYILYIERGEGEERRTKTICRCGLNLANTSRQKREVFETFLGLKLLELFVFVFF